MGGSEGFPRVTGVEKPDTREARVEGAEKGSERLSAYVERRTAELNRKALELKGLRGFTSSMLIKLQGLGEEICGTVGNAVFGGKRQKAAFYTAAVSLFLAIAPTNASAQEAGDDPTVREAIEQFESEMGAYGESGARLLEGLGDTLDAAAAAEGAVRDFYDEHGEILEHPDQPPEEATDVTETAEETQETGDSPETQPETEQDENGMEADAEAGPEDVVSSEYRDLLGAQSEAQREYRRISDEIASRSVGGELAADRPALEAESVSALAAVGEAREAVERFRDAVPTFFLYRGEDREALVEMEMTSSEDSRDEVEDRIARDIATEYEAWLATEEERAATEDAEETPDEVAEGEGVEAGVERIQEDLKNMHETRTQLERGLSPDDGGNDVALEGLFQAERQIGALIQQLAELAEENSEDYRAVLEAAQGALQDPAYFGGVLEAAQGVLEDSEREDAEKIEYLQGELRTAYDIIDEIRGRVGQPEPSEEERISDLERLSDLHRVVGTLTYELALLTNAPGNGEGSR